MIVRECLRKILLLGSLSIGNYGYASTQMTSEINVSAVIKKESSLNVEIARVNGV